MDPLSVQMAMGSPPILRGKVSLSNLIGRKKRSPGSDKDANKTPTRLEKIDEDPLSTPARGDTVRRRRGFRPLSILTNSVFAPIDFDIVKAMEDPAEAAKAAKCLAMYKSIRDATEANVDNATQDHDECDADEVSTLSEMPFSNESELSLRAFLKQCPPPSDRQADIRAPFSTLHTVPPPDLSQHPMFAANPFTSQSDAPTMVTTSSRDDIRKFAAEARQSFSVFTDRTSTGSDLFASTNKKEQTYFQKLQIPISPPKNASNNSPDSSPLARRQPRSRPIEIPYTRSDTPSPNIEKKRSGSGGIRKLSDIFKPRIVSEQTPQEQAEPAARSPVRPLEEYLRTVTCSPTYPYTETSWLPRHPNTNRFWRSRNLKCTNCVNVSCGCCGRTCCAFKAAVMALETHKNNPPGRATALERIQQITSLFPYGREMPTFLRCTSGFGSGAGCGKLVCPECCGVCPDEACGDIQCRKCKKNPWAECDWHTNITQPSSVGDAASIRHTV